MGETEGGSKSSYAAYLGPEWTDAFLAYMLDTSYLAMRTKDILCSAEFLAGYEAGGKPRKVHLVSHRSARGRRPCTPRPWSRSGSPP